jgi:membrane dipeptidase
MLRADLHVHALMAESLFFLRGRLDEERLAATPDDILTNQVSLSTWRQAGIGLAFVALYSPPVLHRGRGHLREILRQVAVAERLAAAHADLIAIARTAAEARDIALSGRTALALAVEGGHGIDAAEDVRALHAAGIRMITLAHLGDNALAAAAVARSPLEGPSYFFAARRHGGAIPRNRNGLTSLGAVAVGEMQRLGMLVDLTHASDRAFDDVLELTRKDGTPLIVSHTASRSLYPSERTISDEHLQAIAERQGAIGVTLFRRLLAVEGEDRPDPFVPGSIDGYVTHFRRLAEIAPAVMLGSDLNGMIQRPRASAACPAGIRHLGDWPRLEQALVVAGVPADHLARSAEMVLATWEAAEALAGHPART